MAALSLVGCVSVGESGAVTVVVESYDGSYTEYRVYLEDVDNKNEGAFGVLEYLCETENGLRELETDSGAYGKYITKIGSLENGKDSKYIMIYTSNEKDFGTWEGVGSLEYEGTLLKESGVGVNQMSLEEGTVILFRAEESEW